MKKPLPIDDLSMIVRYVVENSLDLSGASVLVTGATGFVGSWLIDALLCIRSELNIDMRLTCISRGDKPAGLENIDWTTADLDGWGSISGEFTHVVHAADQTANTHKSGTSADFIPVGYIGAEKLLETICRSNISAKFLYLSSGAVYSKQPHSLRQIPLDWPVARESRAGTGFASQYALNKIETESLVEKATESSIIQGKNARMFSFMGPRLPLDGTYAIGEFMRRAINGQDIQISGSGNNTRSYLNAADMVCDLLFLLCSEQVGNFHVGSPQGRPIRQWAELIATISSRKVHILNADDTDERDYVPESDFRLPDREYSLEKTFKELLRWHTWLIS
jgi:nucleoside-diphosphate-sugar epimerase